MTHAVNWRSLAIPSGEDLAGEPACWGQRHNWQGQFEEDRFAFESFNDTRQRFYVDLAANKPVCSSTTWALEHRGWDGICIDGALGYQMSLRRWRRCAVVRAVVDATVRENASFLLLGGYGGLVGEGMDNQRHQPRGTPEKEALVRTARLLDILDELDAPRAVDYLSLDVEGAELRALGSSELLSRYVFRALTIEKPPPALNQLLFAHGYLWVRNAGGIDSFYVHASHPRASALEANASFRQLPAKCVRGRHIVARLQRQNYTECHHRTQLTVRSMRNCCEYPGFPDRTVRYGF